MKAETSEPKEPAPEQDEGDAFLKAVFSRVWTSDVWKKCINEFQVTMIEEVKNWKITRRQLLNAERKEPERKDKPRLTKPTIAAPGAKIESAGRVRWISGIDGTECKSPSPISCFILEHNAQSDDNELKAEFVRSIINKCETENFRDCITNFQLLLIEQLSKFHLVRKTEPESRPDLEKHSWDYDESGNALPPKSV